MDLFIYYVDDLDSIAVRVITDLNKYFYMGSRVEECSPNILKSAAPTEIIYHINTDVDITVFPYISMFLPMILGNKKYESWYYTNFINLMCVNEKGFYNYTDDRSFFREILVENSMQYIKPFNFTKEFFVDSLFENYYIYVWIDSCYTGDWNGSKDTHEAHPILIYGVNKEKNIYYCYRFLPMKGVFLCEYDIDMIQLSMESARCEIGDHVDDVHVCICKPKEIAAESLFDKKRFLCELENYIFSAGDRTKEYQRMEIEITEDTDICFGLSVTQNVIDLLEGTAENVNFDYRLIHLITEHKQLLHKRLSYVMDLFTENIELIRMVNQFAEIARQYEVVKNYFIKQSVIESGGKTFYRPPQSEKAKRKLIDTYRNLLGEEKALLEQIYDRLQYCFIAIGYKSKRTNYYDFALKKTEHDAGGLYEYIFWEEPVTVRKVVIENLINNDSRFCTGKLVICSSEGTGLYECNISKDGRTHLAFKTPKVIKWLKFYPQKWLINEKDKLQIHFNIDELNLLEKAYEIIPSSVFVVNSLDCSAQNMIKEDMQFWSPAVEDRDRSVLFKFEEPISFNCCIITQDPAALRILSYVIEYYDDSWKMALNSESCESVLEDKKFFDRVYNAKMVRLTIKKTIMSPNGFDIPNITKFELYNIIKTDVNLSGS